MNKKTSGILFLFLFIYIISTAQVRNVLSLPALAGKADATIQIPVNLDNTDNVVGVQFDLSVPPQLTIEEDILKSNRWTDHEVIIKKINNTQYRILLFSPSNDGLKGMNGDILTMKANISSFIEDGSSLELKFIDPVASDEKGNNCLTGWENGKIADILAPDLAIADLRALTSSASPGDNIELSWTVSNEGRRAAYSGWKETILAIAEDGRYERVLTTLYYEGVLAPDASIARNASVKLPEVPGVSGQCKIKVEVSPYADFGEPSSMKENNVALSPNSVFIHKSLLTTFPTVLDEASEEKYKFYITRTGDTSIAETFYVTISPQDPRLSCPSSFIIPEGVASSVFDVKINADGIYNDSESFLIAISGEDYEEITSRLNVKDDKYPEISITPSVYEITEGEDFEISVELPGEIKSDVSLYIVSDNLSKINLSKEIKIPAGENKVVIPVTAVDNSEAELDANVKIRVSGNNFTPADCVVTVKDNDMPELALTLSPTSISENAGPSAVIATLSRLSNIDKTATVRLSEDSDGTLFLPKSIVKFGKGVKEIQFSIDVNDNEIIDGERTYNIVAEVYSSYCNCGVGELSGGYVSVPITVTDDDVPHLKIESATSAFLEGSENNYLSITRIDDLKGSLSVTLTSDRDDDLEYGHQIQMSDGMASIQIPVKVRDNEITGDSGIVSFKAEAQGMASGSCWVIITDQTVPDASIKLSLSNEEPKAGETVDLILSVSNTGNAIFPSGAIVEIACKGNDRLKLTTEKEIAKGETAILNIKDYSLPPKIGSAVITATINSTQKIAELTYTNNIHTLDLYLPAAFSASATVDKKTYAQGETVVIEGKTDSEAGKDAEIEIYLVNNGARQAISAHSDESGNFKTEYQLLPSQSGHFGVGACYPGAKASKIDSEFDIIGLKSTATFSTCDVTQGEIFAGKFTINNPSNVSQTNLRILTGDQPEDCEINIKAPSKISAGASDEIEFTLKGLHASSGNNYIKFPLEVVSDEGGKLSYDLYYYVLPQSATLFSDTKKIITTVCIDTPRTYPLTIRNIGKGETGSVSLALPDWITTATTPKLPSLQKGDSVTVMLKLIPDDDMTLNLKRTGSLAVNCENGDGIEIPFEITPVSESTGGLKVDVVDEFTFFTEEAPHVANAKVRISLPSGSEVYSGYTNGAGIFSATLNQGWYVVSVEEENHDSFQANVLVSPGMEYELEAFIPYDAVSYSWEVVETEIEDEYTIETVVDFDTRVPKPLIDLTLPAEKPTVNNIFPVIITNKGLVSAVNADLSIGVNGGFSIEFLTETHFDTLPSQQSVIVFAKLLPPDENIATRDEIIPYSDCFDLVVYEEWDDVCEKYVKRSHLVKSKKYTSELCETQSQGDIGYFGGNGGNGIGGPGSPLGGNSTKAPSSKLQELENPKKYCDPKHPDSGQPGYDPENDPENNPLRREIVKDVEPKKQPCESNQDPVLVYKLVPVSGPRYQMEGVAADGVSQVKIVLDPDKSTIPEDDCDKISGAFWELSRDLGSIEGNSLREAIYTAPENFPGEMGSVANVEAIVKYSFNNILKETSIKISIIRPPVVFIHGLGDSDKCWLEFDNMLTSEDYGGSALNTALYLKNINYRVNYQSTNTSSFNTNVGVVAYGMEIARHRALQQGYVATKCDLIGHSMGGILSRLYIDRGGDSNLVNRIITVNSPHSGSELGDMVKTHKYFLSELAKKFYKNTNIDAVIDLGVGSEATNELLNISSHSSIPVYALGTESNLRKIILKGGNEALKIINYELLKYSIVTKLITILDPEPFTKTAAAILTALTTAASYSANEFQHYLEDDYVQIGDGDLVVSNSSQTGGCDKSHIIPAGPWHCNSPGDEKVMDYLRNLLSKPASDPIFSTNWFNPQKRSFYHNDLELGLSRILSLTSGVSGEIGTASGIVGSGWALKNNMTFDAKIKNEKHAAGRSDEENDSDNVRRKLEVSIAVPEGYNYVLSSVNLNDELAFFLSSAENEYYIPSSFSGEINIKYFVSDNSGNLFWDEKSLFVEEPIATPVKIEAERITMLAGYSCPLRVICTWDDGSETFVIPEKVDFETEDVAFYFDGEITGLKTGWSDMTITYAGLNCKADISVFANDADEQDDEDDSDAICSTVTLSFKQKAVMTRQAFEGTFTLNNGYETSSLLDFRLNIEVTDEEGNPVTPREFEIRNTDLTGFHGLSGLNETWKLLPKTDGTATILFIPTKYAAPEEPKDYNFGGYFSYLDPNTGLTVVRTLTPVTLTVNPSPQLELTYFMQRDVFGDDPLTAEIEEVVPAEFALLINNIGNGDASNLKLVTSQPEIISNEKGLQIDFRLVSTQLNGSENSLMLEDETVTDFGTVEAGKQAYAQWWLESSLLGHFVKYNVKATHVSSHDNPNLSLLDTVTIHELIHGFNINADSPKRAFLVNDLEDENDTPDIIYFTDGTTADVEITDNASFVKQSDTDYILKVTPSSAGWNYGKISDPTSGRRKITAIQRLSDGVFLQTDNFWQTDRTMKDNRDPIKENLLHFVDLMGSGEQAYIVSFTEAAEIELEVEGFSGIPVEGEAITTPLESLVVTFNKPIDESTFTFEDISLACQGKSLKTDEITIQKLDDYRFEIFLNGLTKKFGFYTLTVRTSAITDAEGFNGRTGKSVSWIQNVTEADHVEYLIEDKHEFKAYPVPMESTLYIEGDFSTLQRLLIYDLKGTLKLSATGLPNGSGVNVENLTPGFYIVIADTDNGTYMRKVIKR